MGERRRAQAAARIARRRLDEQPLKRPLPDDAPIRHAVERHPTRHAQIARIDLPGEIADFL